MYRTYVRSLFTLLIMIMFALAIPALASAGSIGNPDTLGRAGAFALSLERDHGSLDLKLKHPGSITYSNAPSESFNASNTQIETTTNWIVATVGVTKDIDLFAALGDVSQAELGFNTEYMNGGADNIEVRDNSNLAYKLGVKGVLARVGRIKIGASGQFSGYTMNDSDFLVNGQKVGNVLFGTISKDTETKVREWQAALTASTDIADRVHLYAGATLSKVSLESNTIFTITPVESVPYSVAFNAKAKGDSPFGAVIGANINVWENLDINAEARRGSEDAYTLVATWRVF